MNDSSNDSFDVAIIGGGSAGEALIRALDGSGKRVVMFEPELVGGECPFLACIPSKAMLHDRTTGRDWAAAVERRRELTSDLDDSAHAAEAIELGATIVRSRARIVGPGLVLADDVEYRISDIVIATGAKPVMPEIAGLDPDHDRVWTSADALTAIDQPASVVIIGGGVIGSELAFMFAGFGTSAVTLDMGPNPAPDLHPKVGELMASALRRGGVEAHHDVEVSRVELTEHDGTVYLADGTSHRAERVIVAVGRTPDVSGLGLDSLHAERSDQDDGDDWTVDDAGRVIGAEHVWMIGDVAGREQYTHVANHHAAVVADHLIGPGSRSYTDSVIPACVFIDPPVMVVGSSTADLDEDDDVVWAEVDVATPRDNTDEHPDGFLAVAARRSTGCVIAANGIGARFDELVHAFVIAIDGAVPVSSLTRMIQPFPTVGEVLGEAFEQLADRLSFQSDTMGQT